MGHPVLRTRARPLEPDEIGTPRIQRLIDDMFETMHDSQGIGLACPQVHESMRLFVAGVDDEDGTMPPVVIINPEITPIGSDAEEDWEGCLSIPDIRGRVSRATDIRVRALDRHGKPISIKVDGCSCAGHPARDRPPGRRAVLRPDDVVREPDVSR